MSRAFILTYHNIGKPPKDARIPNLYVTPAMFRFQMAYLKFAGFSVVPVSELVQAVESGNVNRNLVSITFDDGFVDFYTNAYPVLKQYGYPSTVYVVSNLVSEDNIWDRKIEPVVKPLMSWDMIDEISKNNVVIGSHTESHPPLAEITPAALKRELEGSKKTLEEHLQKTVEHLCYPYGNESAEVRKAAAKAGYRYAVITKRGHIEKGCDPLALRRIPVKLITNPFSFMYKIHTSSERRKGGQR